MKKWILVTGGAGFIGSALVRELNDLGYDRLIIVDNLGSSDKWKNLRRKKFDDLIHKDKLFDLIHGMSEEIQAIFHLGACSSTLETDANYLLENNFHYSVRLASFAIQHRIRFIYASSAATYGDGALGFEDKVDDLETLMPLNMYGYSKHLFDLWLKRKELLNQVTGLKYFNVFGPNEYHKGKMASAIVKMVADAKNTGIISLFKSNETRFKDGEQVRDFIYVKDVARMTAGFLNNQVTGIYNVGSGKAHTWNDLAHSVISAPGICALGKNVKIQYIEMPKELYGKYQNYTKAEMNKWEKARLEGTKYSLKESVHDYVDNHLLLGEQTW